MLEKIKDMVLALLLKLPLICNPLEILIGFTKVWFLVKELLLLETTFPLSKELSAKLILCIIQIKNSGIKTI
jgi:hypothetical protein